jgi:hypothetical protein
LVRVVVLVDVLVVVFAGPTTTYRLAAISTAAMSIA